MPKASSRKISKALLLAAGLGTRLRPITDKTQKCLVPIQGKPLIEYWLDNLTAAGIEEFLINTHYLHEQMKNYIENSKYKEKVTLSYETVLLGTAGTVLNNKDFFQSEPFMVVHADNLCLCNFNEFLDAHIHRPSECEITMMLFQSDDPKSCGIVELNGKGVVLNFFEKVNNPPGNLANGAVYIFEPTIIEFLASMKKSIIDISTEVFPEYLGKIFTFKNNGYHRDIGNPISLKKADKFMRLKSQC